MYFKLRLIGWYLKKAFSCSLLGSIILSLDIFYRDLGRVEVIIVITSNNIWNRSNLRGREFCVNTECWESDEAVWNAMKRNWIRTLRVIKAKIRLLINYTFHQFESNSLQVSSTKERKRVLLWVKYSSPTEGLNPKVNPETRKEQGLQDSAGLYNLLECNCFAGKDFRRKIYACTE